MAWDAYLKIEGLSGESLKEGHEGEIEVIGFSFGAQNQSSVGIGSGGGAGVVSLGGMSIMKKTEAGSAELFQYICTGEHFPSAVLTMYKSGGSAGPLAYLTMEFEELYPVSINWSGSQGGDDVPSENVTFDFGKVTFTYSEQNSDGTKGGDHVGSWDVRTKTP